MGIVLPVAVVVVLLLVVVSLGRLSSQQARRSAEAAGSRRLEPQPVRTPLDAHRRARRGVDDVDR